jgi:hypothetical protein
MQEEILQSINNKEFYITIYIIGGGGNEVSPTGTFIPIYYTFRKG